MSLFSAALFIFLSAAARARIISPYVGTVSQANHFGLAELSQKALPVKALRISFPPGTTRLQYVLLTPTGAYHYIAP